MSTLDNNDPTILECVESYYNIDKGGFGEVMTLFNDESNILKRFQLIMTTKLLSMMIIVLTCML